MLAGMADIGKLVANNKVAEKLLKDLRSKVATYRERVSAAETERLRTENDILDKECEAWRQRLIRAEVANGKKQFAAPTRCTSADDSNGSEANVKKVTISVDAAPAVDAGSKKVPSKEKQTEKKTKKESKLKEASKENVPKAEEPVCVSQLDLRVGVITQIEKHPDADSLYLEQINVGEDKPRTVVSGLVKFIPIEEMRGRTVVVMCNLKPAKMRGVVSEGMVMCASTAEKVEPIRPPKTAVPGDRVTWTGLAAESYPAPESVLNPKKKIWERIAPDLKMNDQCQTIWMNKMLEVRGKGPITADSLKNVQVK